MVELPKALVAIDVAFHLEVRFGTDVVVGGDPNGIFRIGRQGDKGCNSYHQQRVQKSL
jgi:hypothetical protein